MKISYLYLLFLMFITSCGFPKFSFVRVDNISNQFRQDGFYYFEYDNDLRQRTIGDLTIGTMYFFENGLLKMNPSFKNIEGMLSYQEREKKDPRGNSKYKDSWGIYKMEKDKILYEFWYVADTKKIDKGYFMVINDTTLNAVFETNGKEEITIYKFYKTDWKPDSIPDFYKDLDVKRKSQ